MICALCRREGRGWGWFDPHAAPRKHHRFCSKNCRDRFRNRGLHMVDPTDREKKGMEAALGPLGEYVASIDMTRPMADYSRDEILTLIEVVITAYQDHMLNDEMPF